MNIVRSTPRASLTPSSDPFRSFADFVRWDPFAELRAAGAPATFMPDVDVKETKEGLVFRADLPGMKESDVEVALTGNQLTISGKRESEKQEEGEKTFLYERSYGAFSRTFTLPDGMDGGKAHADMKNGVLNLIVPRSPDAQTKRIAVKG